MRRILFNTRRLFAATVVAGTLVPSVGCGASPKDKVPSSLGEPSRDAVNAAVAASRSNAIVTAAAKAIPAVVTINTVQTVRRRVFNPFFSPRWQDFFKDFLGPPYKEYEEKIPSMGSGFIFDAEGYILTAEHVVHGADKINVVLADGRTFPATWLGSDYERDVAVLKIEGNDLPAIELGDSSSALIGEWAIAIGNPFGHVVSSASPTVSVGVVSALHRQMKNAGQGGIRVYDNLLQTDASINPGNSGGPLVNALGQAIGINVTIITTSGGSLGIGFAVPINVARDTAKAIIAEGAANRPWVGVYLQEVTPAVAATFKLADEDGLLIGDIDENGPAYQVNLRQGDVILEVNQKKVNDVASYHAALAGAKPGKAVHMRVRRGNQIMEGNIPTEKRPGP